jgi:hypothetical protein
MLYFLSLTRELVFKNVSYIYELSSFSYSKTSFEAYMLHFMPCFLSLTCTRKGCICYIIWFVFSGSWLFLWRGRIGFLRKEQSQCLRTVAGAYRATPVRSLETETFVPPLWTAIQRDWGVRNRTAHPWQLRNHSKETPEPPSRRRWHYIMPQAYNKTAERVKRWLATDPVNVDRKKIQTTIVKEWEKW